MGIARTRRFSPPKGAIRTTASAGGVPRGFQLKSFLTRA